MRSEDLDNPYILLTPGPLSTSKTVRFAMRYDSCTWDSDYKAVVSRIREKLLEIAKCDPQHYTTVLMQGSGTFGVEATLGCSINRDKHKALILENGLYGRRIVEIAKILRLPHIVYSVPEHQTYDANAVKNYLTKHADITHIVMVHCETTTGILNNLEPVAQLAQEFKKYFIVDAMSSFAGIQFDITKLGIDFLISSANKCIQGVPGFSFIICKKGILKTLCENNEKSLSLSLYKQWQEMETIPGKWRYTSPTHVVLAFDQAIKELEEEGGVAARQKRYSENQQILVKGMEDLGFQAYIEPALQSPIITSFISPEFIKDSKRKFSFVEFYQVLKKKGFVIYPGKVSDRDTFRIGSIGHLFPNDVKRFLSYVKDYTQSV